MVEQLQIRTLYKKAIWKLVFLAACLTGMLLTFSIAILLDINEVDKRVPAGSETFQVEAGIDELGVPSADETAPEDDITAVERRQRQAIAKSQCLGFHYNSEKYQDCIREILRNTQSGVQPEPNTDTQTSTSFGSDRADSKAGFQDYIEKFKDLFDVPFFAIIFIGVGLSQGIALYELIRSFFNKASSFPEFHGWIIDAPPILGICGTLFALITYLEGLSSASNLSGFLVAFSNAAVTTLVGGIAAVTNQASIALSELTRNRNKNA